VVGKNGHPNACFDLVQGLMIDDCSYGIGVVRTLLRPVQAPFTTVMNWQSMAPVTFLGIQYCQKDHEFPKFIDLPGRTGVPLELAVAGRHASNFGQRDGGSETPIKSRSR
jgi:hypothetical protein